MADIAGVQAALGKMSGDECALVVKEAEFGVRGLNVGETPHAGQGDPAKMGRQSTVPPSSAPVKRRAAMPLAGGYGKLVKDLAAGLAPSAGTFTRAQGEPHRRRLQR